MPASYLVDTEHRVVFMRHWGVVTEEELFGNARAAVADERVKDSFDRLIDLSEVTSLAISSTGVRKLAEVARGYAVRRRAIVATSPITFGIARMWEGNLLLPQEASLVCDNLPDAMEFLGLPRETPWPASPNE